MNQVAARYYKLTEYKIVVLDRVIGNYHINFYSEIDRNLYYKFCKNMSSQHTQFHSYEAGNGWLPSSHVGSY